MPFASSTRRSSYEIQGGEIHDGEENAGNKAEADANANENANGNAGANPGGNVRPRAITDHLAPILDDLNPGIVAPNIEVAHFELKPVMFNMLNSIGQFGGSPDEDAR